MTETSQPRYAVYFALPRESGLWRLAQRWLGRDCESGETLEQPALDGWAGDEITRVTESPRRYGFHATLKAPFRLAPGSTPQDLHRSLAGFAARQHPFVAPPLTVSTIGPFLALTLSASSPEMAALAAAAVRDLEPLRAPLNDKDMARRLAAELSPRQEELLRRWGYPYVLEEFRFHMTLTGPLADPERRARLQTALAELFRPELAEPVPVEEISLYSQPSAEQPFTLVGRYALGKAAAAPEKPAADSVEGQTIA